MNDDGLVTRREVMELTGATSNQLQYFERSNLVEPIRILKEGRVRPDVYYTWAQMLEIMAICNLRQETSLQTIRKILDFLEEYPTKRELRDKQIVVIDDEAFWVKLDWSDLQEKVSALKVADRRNKNIGQYTLIIIPALKDIEQEIWENVENSEIIDINEFRERVKRRTA